MGRKYTTYTSELTQAIRDQALEDPDEPAQPDPEDLIEFKLWKNEVKEYNTKVQAYRNFHWGLYSLVLGQCTEALEDRLKSHPEFEEAY